MKDTFYFSHDCNAIQDPKMMTLLSECGAWGVGIYWILVEILHQQRCGSIGKNQFTYYIAFYGKMGAWDQNTLERVERVLFDTGLLIEKDGEVTSARVTRNIERRSELKEKGKANAMKRWGANGYPMRPQCDPNARKERKGKERKDKDKDASSAPTNNVGGEADPVVLIYPTVGTKDTWELKQSQVDEWIPLFPNVDVPADCGLALAWVRANNRKTPEGMKRFLVSWLTRTQNGFRGAKKQEVRHWSEIPATNSSK